jgi:betaine lipid synthase
MGTFVDVSNFFSTVYLVDLSPSLCEIARRRFQRLGWNNVKVICEDARTFSLSNYKSETSDRDISAYLPASNYFCPRSMQQNHVADLITMSYSLSMIVSALIPTS